MSGGIFQGTYLIAAALLVAGGVHGLFAPSAVETALRAQRLPAPPGSGRVLGVLEIAAGTSAFLVTSAAPAAAIAAIYGAFAVFVGRAARRHTPCGCLGASDRPARLSHAALDAAFALVAFAVAVTARPAPLAPLLADQPLHGIPLAALLVTGTALGALLGSSATIQHQAIRHQEDPGS
jgi:hypothetical protein